METVIKAIADDWLIVLICTVGTFWLLHFVFSAVKAGNDNKRRYDDLICRIKLCSNLTTYKTLADEAAAFLATARTPNSSVIEWHDGLQKKLQQKLEELSSGDTNKTQNGIIY